MLRLCDNRAMMLTMRIAGFRIRSREKWLTSSDGFLRLGKRVFGFRPFHLESKSTIQYGTNCRCKHLWLQQLSRFILFKMRARSGTIGTSGVSHLTSKSKNTSGTSFDGKPLQQNNLACPTLFKITVSGETVETAADLLGRLLLPARLWLNGAMKIIAADHVLPISSGPIANGAVVIDGAKIAAVGTRNEIERQFPGIETQDFGEAAIMPGMVNCHSHLEITSMRGALDDVEHDFSAWLLKLNALRAGLSDDDIRAAAIDGAMEGARAGVTCFGDIGRLGHAGVNALRSVGLRGIVFQETDFSPDNRTAGDDFLKLAAKFELLKNEETELVRVGLSPHSPYTVGSRLFELIAQYAIINRVPLTIHAAESLDEHELMTQGTGFFTSVYEKYGVEWESPHCTPIEYLERLGVLSTQPLLAHCVTVSGSDIAKIAANGAKIAHCPKSNAKFGHGYAPFEAFLNAGIAVGLGSDSVASNNTCDLLEESRFAALSARNREGNERFISAKEMLETATLGGAKALGLDGQIGTLESGKQADIIVISLANIAQQPVSDVHTALVFASNARDVVMTLVSGRRIH